MEGSLGRTGFSRKQECPADGQESEPMLCSESTAGTDFMLRSQVPVRCLDSDSPGFIDTRKAAREVFMVQMSGKWHRR